MRSVRLFFCAGWLLFACAGPPSLAPLPEYTHAALALECRNVFPAGRWQLTHSIEATAPDGGKNVLMGVMILSSKTAGLSCALMTLEGFVLFEAVLEENGLKINRAIPPFDSPALAHGMMADIQLIFLAPKGIRCEFGRLKNEEMVCRHHMPDGSILDMTVHADESWEINQYNNSMDLLRTVKATDMTDSFQQRMPKTMKLKAHGFPGYEMTMHLIEALPLEEPNKR